MQLYAVKETFIPANHVTKIDPNQFKEFFVKIETKQNYEFGESLVGLCDE